MVNNKTIIVTLPPIKYNMNTSCCKIDKFFDINVYNKRAIKKILKLTIVDK